jgi:hypothetical protein
MTTPIPPRPDGEPDAREVRRVELLATALDDARAADFLARCVAGSRWVASIRTATVSARVVARMPLGIFDERICSCVRLFLDRPVPVEPGLRIRIADEDDPTLVAAGVVRPWDG